MIARSDNREFTDASVLPREVRRVLEYMRAHLDRDCSLADLAIIAGVSGRTVQRQFRSFLNKSPGAVLHDLRFDRARRELLRSLPGTKVTDVALRCGFQHCGRFSVDYRRRYDETPTQTLKRQAVFASALASAPSFFPSGRDRPSVAFGPIEASPEHGEFARSIADELSGALTRAGMFVPREPGTARYRIFGVLRGAGGQARLSFRLFETETGRQLWAHRVDGPFGDGLVPDEHLATRIAGAIQPSLRLAEIDRAQRLPDVDVGSRDLALRAMPGVLSLDMEGNAQALDLLERAMDRDPGNALATALAAWARVQRVVYHFTATPLEDRAQSLALARKAQAMAVDATVLAVLGNAFTLLKELEAAELMVGKALATDGGSAWAWSRSGWIDLYNGDPRSAIERLGIALDLAPLDSFAFNSMVGIGCAHFEAGNYREAARWQERALIAHPSAIWVHRTLCPAYALAGAESEARRSMLALRTQYPDLTIAEVRKGLPPLSQSYSDRMVGGLQSIGLPA
jgi:AraC-like DNA-binding protein/tetratricopeptide (TPR) repeat protein